MPFTSFHLAPSMGDFAKELHRRAQEHLQVARDDTLPRHVRAHAAAHSAGLREAAILAHRVKLTTAESLEEGLVERIETKAVMDFCDTRSDLAFFDTPVTEEMIKAPVPVPVPEPMADLPDSYTPPTLADIEAFRTPDADAPEPVPAAKPAKPGR